MELEISSDIACPWCYIGKRRLETALGASSTPMRWPSGGAASNSTRRRRPNGRVISLGTSPASTEFRSSRPAKRRGLTATAAAEGLAFRFDLARSGSTFNGHRLVHLAGEHGAQEAMKERLLQAYFSEGRLISDPETLLFTGAEVGLPEREIHELLGSEHFAEEVRGDERAATELGISGVPTFIVDRTVGVTGAQPPELILEMLRQGWVRRESALAT